MKAVPATSTEEPLDLTFSATTRRASIEGLLIILSCVLLLSGHVRAGSPEYFPLEKGNYWIYRGDTSFLVKDPDTGGNKPKTEVLTWKMEVVETATRQNLFAALIKGAPHDLAWYQPGKARGDYLILRIGSASYYLIGGESARSAWANIKDESRPLDELEPELILDAPLMDGKIFGGDFLNLVRGKYCWVVRSERPFNPKRFPAAGKLTDPRDFTLVYLTNPDDTTVDFVPGIGIVGYQYNHHGTLSRTDLGLVEFGTAQPAK